MWVLLDLLMAIFSCPAIVKLSTTALLVQFKAIGQRSSRTGARTTSRRSASSRCRLKSPVLPLACLVWVLTMLPQTRAAVIRDIWGANHSEVLYASSGGGTHVYISGTDIGSAFAPPTVLLGLQGQVECKVQPFTSARNRMHCIVSAANAPAPLPEYTASGSFVSLPLRMITRGRLVECWHNGTLGAPCAVRFDVGGTPRVLRVLTPVVESAGTLRLAGMGIDGGLRGAQRLAASLYRGAVPVLGACGEKDCQASNMGAETLGCYSRPDAGGDGVIGGAQSNSIATAFSDATRFGCVLDRLSDGLTGGYFNVSLTAITDSYHRGDAYLGFMATRLVDVATGAPPSVAPRGTLAAIIARTNHPHCPRCLSHPTHTHARTLAHYTTPPPVQPLRGAHCLVAVTWLHRIAGNVFDAEMPPRIASIRPSVGSLAGGTDLTVVGTGFGADVNAIAIHVAGIPCDVLRITTSGVNCRLRSQPSASAPTRLTPTAHLGSSLGSFPGERGVRWQWAGASGSMILPSFASPTDCSVGCGSGWSELGSQGTAQVIEVSAEPSLVPPATRP